MDIRIQSAPFDQGKEANKFAKTIGNAGAMVTFTGIVRDSEAGNMEAMEIEHYPGMTEQAISKIAKDAQTRWDLSGILIIHRYGRLECEDQIMMVATASRHRVAAFEAAQFLMDYLKSRAPFWKKEIGADGAEWVAAKDHDEEALSKWDS